MQANLSLVLDEFGKVRYDLMKDVSLREIDKYTTTKVDHHEIREDYKEQIASFLESQKEFTSTFKREENKKGSIVILYHDDDPEEFHKLRVLYRKHAKKLNEKATMRRIVTFLKEENDLDFTIQTILERSFIFGSDFALKEISIARKKAKTSESSKKDANIRLVNRIIKNKFIDVLEKNPEKAYFYIRKVDSYIEKCEKRN